jgi:cell wall-associated NlpC family hydrolase
VTATEYAKQFVGKPYIWGGKCLVQGSDCSGLVCELLKAAGVFKSHENYGSQDLYNALYMKSKVNVRGPGALAFYGTNISSIEHVAYMLDGQFVIEAGGGDHTTTSEEQAIAQNAMIRVRLINHRPDLLITLLPLYQAGVV